MPFGPRGEHVPVRLVDFAQPANNRLTVCNQWTYRIGSVEKRFDVVFVVNGLPLIIGEAKTPTRSAVTWFDGAFQVNDIYEKQVPAMFVPNVFSFATEGRLFRYGSVRMPIDMWGPWRDDKNQDEGQLHHVRAGVESMLRPDVVLDILQNFTLFATDNKHRRIKGCKVLLFQRFSHSGCRCWRRWDWLRVPPARDTSRKARSGCDPGCRRTPTDRSTDTRCCAAASPWGCSAIGIPCSART